MALIKTYMVYKFEDNFQKALIANRGYVNVQVVAELIRVHGKVTQKIMVKGF